MEEKDIRWEQRFSNYRKALKNLNKAIEIVKNKYYEEIDEDSENIDDDFIDDLESVIKEGLIQRFEYTYELAWNLMKDYAEYQGETEIKGSRDATRNAFKMKLIRNSEVWMDMLMARRTTSHTYNEETAEEILQKIINNYHVEFLEFEKTMEQLRTGKQGNIFDKEL